MVLSNPPFENFFLWKKQIICILTTIWPLLCRGTIKCRKSLFVTTTNRLFRRFECSCAEPTKFTFQRRFCRPVVVLRHQVPGFESLRTHLKTHCNVFFAMRFLFWFCVRIVSVAYHLLHPCTALSPVARSSVFIFCRGKAILSSLLPISKSCRNALLTRYATGSQGIWE